ncbi:hypothetical protein [Flavobacterium sp. GCM10023249]|uniref:hypothetical protein n=1 Tax=unclassified Flavobacterium TaxID=196869 RepID=UPI003614853F
MRKTILLLLLLTGAALSAQDLKGIYGESNWLRTWTNFKPKTSEYRETTTLLTGIISQNTVLQNNQIYLLTGVVYVTKGATLFIEPGTVIRGDFETDGLLVITKGSKIVAIGDEANPIVFTSNKPQSERKAGDWGGIIVMGDAPTNKFSKQLDFTMEANYNSYGGENLTSDSGVMKYVRIEFAGKKGKHKKCPNGLSLAGVGRNTLLSNIQVSFSGDDSFEFYGGNVFVDKLVSFRALDDDFDFTEGVQCVIENSVAVRNSFVSSPEGSRSLEVESYDVASNADFSKKLTNVESNYLTLINDNNEVEGVTNEAIYVKERANLTFKNSVISGFKQGVLFDGQIKGNIVQLQPYKFENVLFNKCGTNFISENSYATAAVVENYNREEFFLEKNELDPFSLFIESDLKKTPDLRFKSALVLASKDVAKKN